MDGDGVVGGGQNDHAAPRVAPADGEHPVDGPVEDPERARRAELHIFAALVVDRQQFWGSQPFLAWIEKTAEKVFSQLRRENRPPEAPPNTGPDPAYLAAWADAIEALVLSIQRRRQAAKLISITAAMSAFILAVAGFLWWINQPERDPGYIPPDQVRFFYEYTAVPGDTLESIARFAGVSPEAIKTLNPAVNFSTFAQDIVRDKDRYSYDLKLPVLKSNLSFFARLESKLPRFQPLRPLTPQSSPAAIRQRILKSDTYWRTLFADVWLTYYGVPGYLGRPDQHEEQIWLRKPNQMRYLILNPDRSISFAEFMDGDRYYGVRQNDNVVFLSPLTRVDGDPLDRLYPTIADIKNIDAGSIQVIGAETVAGRDALVVDWLGADGRRTDRLWVDTWLGIVLAWRAYAGDGVSPQVDMTMDSLHINEMIDDRIFDPSKGVFINNATVQGTPSGPLAFIPDLNWGSLPAAPQALQSPPPGFDPAQSRLLIEWPQDNQILPAPQDPEGKHQVRLFADQYYLGSLDFGVSAAYFLNCSRSPDGKLAAVTLNTGAGLPGNHLYWFSLDKPAGLNALTNVEQAGYYLFSSLAFSPDSQALAFAACEDANTNCRIFIAGLPGGEARPLAQIPTAALLLAWSPDGSRLASVTLAQGEPYGSAVLTIYAAAGSAELYRGPFDLQTYQPAADALLQGWSIDFSSIRLGGPGCAVP